MIPGNSVIFQIGKETNYGVAGSATQQIQISSETLKEVYNKVEEGVATGGRGQGKLQTMGIGVEGGFNTLLRPDMGLIFKALLGVETTTSSTDGTKHTFTAIENDENAKLPSVTAYINRRAGKFAYVGAKINSLNLSADAGNYVSCEIALVGKQENKITSLDSLTPSALKAFKFAGGKVYIDGVEVADVTSESLSINNNLTTQVQTSSTGVYYKEPQVGVREISASLSVIYSASVEQIREALYKTDDTFSLKLEYVSDEKIDDGEPYKLTITVPCCQMQDSNANMGGLDTMPADFTIRGEDNLSDELITVELINEDSTAY